MFSAGVQNPRLGFLISIGVTVVACASIVWGVLDMQAMGEETLGSGLKIGLALLPAIIGPLMAWNFWGGMKVFAAMRRGEKVIARWTVSPAELAAFTVANKARNLASLDTINDWTPPRVAPRSGVEVNFTPDGVLIGDTYFALVTTGLFRFTHVWMLAGTPQAIAFRTLTTYANRFGTRTTASELRVPVPPAASVDAAKLVSHFEKVEAGEIIASSGFYDRRMRLGLMAAPICFSVAIVGSLIGPNWAGGDISPSVIMVVAGVIFGIGALVLALAAWLMGRAQRRRR